MESPLKVTQINLHHSRSASAILGRKIARGEIDIALIQEPWTRNGNILGLGVKGYSIFYDSLCSRPRACIIVSSKLNTLNLVNYLNGDNVAVRVTSANNGYEEVINFMSAYLPYEDSQPLSSAASAFLKHCAARKEKLIFGCDANAHHVLWGSSNCNKRGDILMEDILHHDLFILNRGNEPTFVTVNRSEVIDLTLCNGACYDHVGDWRVSDEITLSDHRLITFSVTGLSKPETVARNPCLTRWKSYVEDLKELTAGQFDKLSSIDDLELAVDQLQQSILLSYYQNCEATSADSPRLVPWWSKELSILRRNCRKLFNRAKKGGNWQDYRTALTTYNKAVRDSKRKSWMTYCDSINDVSATSRLVKIMSKDKGCNLNAIKLPNGGFTDSGIGTLTEMFKVHFPGCQEANMSSITNVSPSIRCGRHDWEIARKVVTFDKVIWAINSFSPFKTPGMDGIFPVLLVKGIDVLAPFLCRIFRACIAFGHVPSAWRHTKAVFIPKIGKDNYYEAKSFRPICLTSFLLKAVEKLVDRYIRDYVLPSCPLSLSQHAYQPGKSTDSALYHLSFILESNIRAKEIALAAFLDIEGAFDKVPVDTILMALINRGVSRTIVNWITNLLSFRFINASLCGENMMIHAKAGCPQGGVLSPILWCLVVDSLLDDLNRSGVSCVGYADDIVIIVRGKFPNTVSSIMSDALVVVESWCNKEGLSVNPQKTTVVAFTSRRTADLGRIMFCGRPLFCSDSVKFLGVHFDKKLSWKNHFDYCLNRARKAFWTCRSAIGRTWGLSPKVIRWIYSMILCPIITYGAVVW